MLFWLALTLGLLATLASIVYAVVKGLELYRDSKRVLRVTGEELDSISRSTAQIELHLEAAAASGTALSASLTRLRASQARLNVLRSAIDDVRASVGRVTSFVPRK